MAPYYKLITSSNSILPLDQTLLTSLEKLNKEELDKLDERLSEAEKTEGESDIADALRARASYLTRIGDKVGPIIYSSHHQISSELIGVFFNERRTEL